MGFMMTIHARMQQELSFEFDDLNKWYNGYSTENGIRLLKPWSISNALTTGKLTTWWTKSGKFVPFTPQIETHLVRL